jgi:shikimate dehydrogenase
MIEEQLPERLAVLGDPVEHSLSPEMHNAALQSLHLPHRYVRRRVSVDQLAAEFHLLQDRGYLGWNLTLPLKIAALDLVDHVDPVAERLGAVNTIVSSSDRLFGFNTDGFGLVAAIHEAFGSEVRNIAVAVLGAGGGAGAAVSRYLAMKGVNRLFLVNRTSQKAIRLADELSAITCVEMLAWEEMADVFARSELIINATTLGLAGEIIDWPGEWIKSHHRVFDMVYRRNETPLVEWARQHGAQAADGVLMLLHQGIGAFELWFGKPAPQEVMREALFRAAGR